MVEAGTLHRGWSLAQNILFLAPIDLRSNTARFGIAAKIAHTLVHIERTAIRIA